MKREMQEYQRDELKDNLKICESGSQTWTAILKEKGEKPETNMDKTKS